MTEEEQRNIPEDVEERLETFKQQKAKTNFTRARHKLLALIDDDHPPRRSEVREECRKLDTALETAMCVMENVSEEYTRVGDRYNRRKLGREIEHLENEFTEAQNRGQEYLDLKQNRSLRVRVRETVLVRDAKKKFEFNRTWILKPSQAFDKKKIFQLNHAWILKPSQVFHTKIKFDFILAWMIETFIIKAIGSKTRSGE